MIQIIFKSFIPPINQPTIFLMGFVDKPIIWALQCTRPIKRVALLQLSKIYSATPKSAAMAAAGVIAGNPIVPPADLVPRRAGRAAAFSGLPAGKRRCLGRGRARRGRSVRVPCRGRLNCSLESAAQASVGGKTSGVGVDVIGIGSRKVAVLDLCIESAFSSCELNFWYDGFVLSLKRFDLLCIWCQFLRIFVHMKRWQDYREEGFSKDSAFAAVLRRWRFFSFIQLCFFCESKRQICVRSSYILWIGIYYILLIICSCF